MLTRQEVREDVVPQAPIIPWNVGLEGTMQVTHSGKAREKDMRTQELLESKAVVVTGILQHPLQAMSDTKGQVFFNAGDTVQVWFSSGARTSGLLAALDAAQSDLLDGGLLWWRIGQLPSTQPGKSGMKTVECRYTPPAPGMARNDVAQGAMPMNGQGYQQPVYQGQQPVYQQQAPMQPQPAYQGQQPVYQQPTPMQQPMQPQPAYQGQQQQAPMQQQGGYQQPAPMQQQPGFQGYDAANQQQPEQPGVPQGAATMNGLMAEYKANQANQGGQQPQS